MAKPPPERLTLLVPRAEALRQLDDLVSQGNAFTRRRSPPDLRSTSTAARDLSAALRHWNRSCTQVAAACLGPEAAQSVRDTPLRYTTLAQAQAAVRRRLAVLRALREAVAGLRKRPSAPVKQPTEVRPRPVTARPPSSSERPYHFCLSFAGEDRKHAQALHRLLERRGLKVFYDSAEQHNLWGRNLYEHLAHIYEHQAHFCVMFVSRQYVKKDWTTLEREFAQARAFKQPDYILPVRLDGTRMPGLASTRGYLDARQKTMAEIADHAVRLLATRRPDLAPASEPKPAPRRTRPVGTGKAQPARLAPPQALLGELLYEVARHREAGDTVTLHLKPRTGEEEARLRTLRDGASRAPYGTVPFAYRLDGALVQIDGVVFRGEGHQALAVVTLRPERHAHQRMYIGQDDAALAEGAARFVLFAQPPQSREAWSLPMYGRDMDAQLRAGLVSTLWQGWTGTKAAFLTAVKLHLVFALKSLGVVEHLTALDVGPWKGDRLPIALRGHRPTPFGDGRTEVQVHGEVVLPNKASSAPGKR